MRTTRFFVGELWVICKKGLDPRQRQLRYQRIIDAAYALGYGRCPAPSKWEFQLPEGSRRISEHVELPDNPNPTGSRDQHVFAAFRAKAELAAAQGRISMRLHGLSEQDIVILSSKLDSFPPIQSDDRGFIVTWPLPKIIRFDGRSRQIRDQREVL